MHGIPGQFPLRSQGPNPAAFSTLPSIPDTSLPGRKRPAIVLTDPATPLPSLPNQGYFAASAAGGDGVAADTDAVPAFCSAASGAGLLAGACKK